MHCNRYPFMKTQVLEAIGETELQRSSAVNAALAANDRLKYYFSLLQIASAHADHPDPNPTTLRKERVACGVDEPAFDEMAANSRRQNRCYRLPGCARTLARITQDLRVMATPVLTGKDGKFGERMERLLAQLPCPVTDLIPADAVDAITRAGRGKTDSIHQLVMDLHKVLNRMQSELAEESLDGASVYHIEDADRPLIAAFMEGLNRTAPLKFKHPGLATTATRVGDKLVIQNDIGTTDAHVIVIHVEGMRVRITYADIHVERIRFFQDMLKPHAVVWETDQTRQLEASADTFRIIAGIFNAQAPAALLEYLSFLGSRLVFLIDWNRARKQLRGFLRGTQRIELLAWAAQEEVGHRGFLEAGGARLINEAIEETAGSAMHFGDRLCDVLGDAPALEFVRFVFRQATQALREHPSLGLLRDRIRAELQVHFSSEGKRLLQLANEHAGIVFEIASLVRDAIRGVAPQSGPQSYHKLAKRARAFEHDADQLVIASRDAVRRRPEYNALFRIVETADDAADGLEEVAFLLELLMNSKPDGEAWDALGALADILTGATQEWIKALSHAVHVDRGRGGASHEDAGDFLAAIDALAGLEHQADDAERALTFAAVQHARDFRQLHVYVAMAHSLEEAADALKWAGLLARDYLLGNVLAA